MKKILLSLTLSLCAWSAAGQVPWVQTVIATNFCRQVPDEADTNHLIQVCTASTNVVNIPAGQAARAAMFSPPDVGAGPLVFSQRIVMLKGGRTWTVFKGDVVQGPAEFVIRSTETESTLLTLERWRVPKVIPVK